MSNLAIDFKPSPNHSSRNGVAISLIVLHATVGDYTSALNWLRNPQPNQPKSRVSTHYLIRRDGHVAQLVTDDQCAWHAVRARWLGHADINERSIGVELENDNSGHDPYPAAQLDTARDLCRLLVARYHILRAGVARHLDVATPAGRKTDPAGFPWPSFADSLYADAPPVLSPIPHPPSPIGHYTVLQRATGGATIRAFPRTSAAVLGRLAAGDPWEGEQIEAQTATFVQGFGSSKIWIRALDQRVVWSGLLERVP